MLKWIDIGQLRLGMFIFEQGGQWLDKPFWRSKFLLKNPDDLQLIKNSGVKRVCIDTDNGLDVVTVVPAKSSIVAVPTPKPPADVSIDEE